MLQVPPATLSTAVWSGRIPEPPKFGGSFMWSKQDVIKAAEVLKKPIPTFEDAPAAAVVS